jgi:hypothetical protein
MEKERLEREKADKERMDRLVQTITASVSQKLSSQVEKAVRNEIQSNLLPNLGRVVTSTVEKTLFEKVQPQLEQVCKTHTHTHTHIPPLDLIAMFYFL